MKFFSKCFILSKAAVGFYNKPKVVIAINLMNVYQMYTFPLRQRIGTESTQKPWSPREGTIYYQSDTKYHLLKSICNKLQSQTNCLLLLNFRLEDCAKTKPWNQFRFFHERYWLTIRRLSITFQKVTWQKGQMSCHSQCTSWHCI